jgi:hypothetical protein
MLSGLKDRIVSSNGGYLKIPVNNKFFGEERYVKEEVKSQEE